MRTTFQKTLVVTTLLTLTSTFVSADEQFQNKKLVVGGYYSAALRCSFLVREVHYNGYTVRAARLVSNPRPGSPLMTLGLKQGDVIFRLDGVPVSRPAELENHYDWTTVRFVRQGTGQILNKHIFINTDNHYVSNDMDDDFGQP